MESSNVKRANELISRYPEVFESLVEFENTKRLPKLYQRKRLNITIDENILRDFKTYCEAHNINMSRLIEKKMVDSMDKNKTS